METIQRKYAALAPRLNERTRRCWAATQAQTLGYGGVSLVARATGVARGTSQAGLREIEQEGAGTDVRRIRQPGGGRKKLTMKAPALVATLNQLVEPTTRGAPESPLRWTCKSTAKLAEALRKAGHPLSQRSVCTLLYEQHYSLPANRKTREGTAHPDREAQFHYLSESVQRFQRAKQPVISVATKKKELVGPFKNPGREWHSKGHPEEVNSHAFVDPLLGKGISYGVYELTATEGWVNVGIAHDTAAFALESMRRWWHYLGTERYPRARQLLITADCGGSKGSRTRLWKVELQRLADDLGLTIQVRHFPPGTRKWNKLEPRLFCFITQNWRGRPLLSRATGVNLIAHTTTRQGLKIRALLDDNPYETGRKVSDGELHALKVKQEAFQGGWNYSLIPRDC